MKGKNQYSIYDLGMLGMLYSGKTRSPKSHLSTKPKASAKDRLSEIRRRSSEYEDDYWRNKLGKSL